MKVTTFGRAAVTAGVVLVSRQTPGQAPSSTAPAIYNPSWAPDGRLLFESDEGGRYALWVVGTDGSTPRRFLPVDFDHGQAVVSPDGKRVAFVANEPPTGNDIYVVNVGGTGRENVTRAPGSQYLPRWSPDSKKILYVSDVPGTRERDLLVIDVQTKAVTNLTNSPTLTESNAGWAPGTRIVYTVREGDSANLFTINADGSDRRQLTRGLQAGSPSWSPNGTIFFVSRHEGLASIYTMNSDGQHLRRFLTDSVALSNPVWSPDGQRMAFIAKGSGPANLFVTDTSGNRRTCRAGACR